MTEQATSYGLDTMIFSRGIDQAEDEDERLHTSYAVVIIPHDFPT